MRNVANKFPPLLADLHWFPAAGECNMFASHSVRALPPLQVPPSLFSSWSHFHNSAGAVPSAPNAFHELSSVEDPHSSFTPVSASLYPAHDFPRCSWVNHVSVTLWVLWAVPHPACLVLQGPACVPLDAMLLEGWYQAGSISALYHTPNSALHRRLSEVIC